MTDSIQAEETAPDPPPAPPQFVPVELGAIVRSGVMNAANERFFWPLGLALAVFHDPVTGEYTNLHVRQYQFADGHRETIHQSDDSVASARREAFLTFVRRRVEQLPEDERAGALALIEKELTPR